MADVDYVRGLKADADEARKMRASRGVTYRLLIYGWNGEITVPYTAVYEFRTLSAAEEALKFFERDNLIAKVIHERTN